MRATVGRLLDGGDRVTAHGVDHYLGPEALRVGEFALVDVDRAHVKPHGLRELDPEMPEATDTGDRDPFAGLCLGDLDPLVRGDAGADQRRCFLRGETGRDVR